MEFVDVLVVYGDASGGPVYVAAVQDGLVAAVDSDSAADADRAAVFDRDDTAIAQLLVAAAVEDIGIVQREEPFPSPARMLLDDCVNALGRAPISLP